MRRLGDLNLESSESERIERELATNEGLRATEAIHLYTALLKAYPKYERNDSVLYQLARAYELNAQPDKALATLDRLVANYPNSQYIDEAQFRRGEILFSNKSYPAAQAAYEAVIKFGSDVGVLQPEPLQARLVAVQAGRERAQPRFLRRRARLGAGVEERSEDLDRARDVEQAESRAGRGHVPRHVHHLLLRGRAEDHRRVREARKQQRPYYYLLYARLGDLYIEKERYTDAADMLSRVRLAGSQQREGAAPRDAGDRGLLEGRLPASWCSRARRSSSRTTATAPPTGRAAPRRANPRWWTSPQDQLEGRRAVLPRAGAAHEERGGLPGSGEMVPQLPDLVPGRSRIPRSRTTCWPIPCSRASSIWTPRSSTRTPPTLRRARQGGGRPATRRWWPTARRRRACRARPRRRCTAAKSTAR